MTFVRQFMSPELEAVVMEAARRRCMVGSPCDGAMPCGVRCWTLARLFTTYPTGGEELVALVDQRMAGHDLTVGGQKRVA